MKRFIEGEDGQSILFSERLDDYISKDNPVRAIDAFVEELDLGMLGFDRNAGGPWIRDLSHAHSHARAERTTATDR